VTIVAALWALSSQGAAANGNDMVKQPAVNPGPCFAAIAEADDGSIVGACGELIANDRTARADRLKALIARAGVFSRRDQADRAIADYSAAVLLDPTQADIFNSRGELFWKLGDRPKALADFAAALKLNPDHPAAKANHKLLARELERQGALLAVAGKPSFNCARARRPVEKAICASPELADLDREINDANAKVLREAQGARERRALQRQQDAFIARRNADFGKPGYDLQRAMRDRLKRLLDLDGREAR